MKNIHCRIKNSRDFFPCPSCLFYICWLLNALGIINKRKQLYLNFMNCVHYLGIFKIDGFVNINLESSFHWLKSLFRIFFVRESDNYSIKLRKLELAISSKQKVFYKPQTHISQSSSYMFRVLKGIIKEIALYAGYSAFLSFLRNSYFSYSQSYDHQLIYLLCSWKFYMQISSQ